MKTKLSLILVIVCALLLTAMSSAFAATTNTWPAHLEIVNKTTESVFLRLYNGNKVPTDEYYFEVKDKDAGVFEVTRQWYFVDVSACGYAWSGVVNLTKNLHITIPKCASWLKESPQWMGEPGQEKINWALPYLYPWKYNDVMWQFLY